jgi:nicotinamidase-related amidase
MKPRVHLLIIDAQNDFCDLPPDWCPTDPVSGQRLAPALPVPGAHADMLRLAAFVDQAGGALTDITVTLDSHHLIDIAHPGYWCGAQGQPVAPFTPITLADVQAGTYQTRDAAEAPRALAYLQALEARGRYTLMVWPVHCQMGSWGHGLHPQVLAACNRWEAAALQPVRVVHKGDHPYTEHYSALEAEVPDAAVPITQLNRALLGRLDQADWLLVAGQASSHCVKATVEHLVQHLPGARPERLWLLDDAMSPVAGFEAQAQGFLQQMHLLGVRRGSGATAAAALAAG